MLKGTERVTSQGQPGISMFQHVTVTAAAEHGVCLEAEQQLQLCVVAHLRDKPAVKPRVAVL
jgi:hypothetical protein